MRPLTPWVGKEIKTTTLPKAGRVGHPAGNRDSSFWWPALGAVYYARDFYRILGHAVDDEERKRRHR